MKHFAGMGMMGRWLAGIVGLVLLLAACSQGPSGSPPKADDAFGTKVRAFLLAHPEILDEMVQALEAKRAADRQNAIAALRPQLENDKGDPAVGAENATITLVEFFDYQCGYCKSSLDFVRKLKVDHPDIRIVFKEFPIFGEDSVLAAKAGLAAARQGKYFDFHAALLAHKGVPNQNVIERTARDAGLDVARLRADMQLPEINARISTTNALAQKLGVDGTPSFFINGRHVPGADFVRVEAEIAALRRERESGPVKAKPEKS